jgi:hypothetical protein
VVHEGLVGLRLVVIEPSNTTRQILERYATTWGMEVDSFRDDRSGFAIY